MEMLQYQTNLKIAIIGSRDFTDYSKIDYIMAKIDRILNFSDKTITVVSGGAPGADTLGEDWAKNNNHIPLIFEAEWNNLELKPCKVKMGRYGPYNALAGFNRNNKIIENSDLVVAFWNGTSPGTTDSIKKAKKQNKPVVIYDFINDNFYGDLLEVEQ